MENFRTFKKDLFVELTNEERKELRENGVIETEDKDYYLASTVAQWSSEDCHTVEKETYCGQIYGVKMTMFISDSVLYNGYRYVGNDTLYLIETDISNWGAESKCTYDFEEAIDYFNKIKGFFEKNLYFYKTK